MSIEELQKEINQFNNSPIANMTDEQIDALTKENEERQFSQEVLNLLRQINEKLVRTY
jgi:DNA replication initiation complex subunit (GINS family)